VAVAVGLRTPPAPRGHGIEETSVRALARVEQVRPPRLRRRVGAVADDTVPIPPDIPVPAVAAQQSSTAGESRTVTDAPGPGQRRGTMT
jgi:hypothetical protein